MTKVYRSSLMLFVLALAAVFAQAQQSDTKKPEAGKPETAKAEAPLQMMTYQMVLFKAAPAKTS